MTKRRNPFARSASVFAALAFAGGLALLLAACAPRPETPPGGTAGGTANALPKDDTATAPTALTVNVNLAAVPSVATTVAISGVVDAHAAPIRQATRARLLDSGRVYFQACAICHGNNGRGGRGPAVANSDYAQGDKTRLIRTVLEGVKEPIHVNGVRWRTGEMLGWADTWDDFKIAAVLTWIRAALNDSTVTSCIPEDYETGTWASCTLEPRDAGEWAADSISVRDVAEARRRWLNNAQ